MQVDTGLAWPVKTSFLRYVGSDPGAETRVAAGAGQLDNGAFYFSFAGTSKGRYLFRGAVSFRAHDGILHVAVVDPVIDMTNAVLLVRVDNQGTLTPLVDLDFPIPQHEEAVTMWENVNTALRMESVELFSGVYAPGTSFDPLTIRVDATVVP